MAFVIVAELNVCVGGEGDLAIATAHPSESMCSAVPTMADVTKARVVAVDPRGVGASPPPARHEDASLEKEADDLDAVRRQMGIDRWVLWGMSGGSMLAQVYAHRHAGALCGLILDSAGPCFAETLADPDSLMSPASPSIRDALADAGLDSGGDGSGELAWKELPGAGWVLRRGTGRALLVSPGLPSEAMRRITPGLLAFDARPWLDEIDVPTLVLGGTEDRIAPPRQLRALHAAIPGAEMVLIDGAGHVPLGEGRPEVANAVRRFLEKRVKR